MVNQSVVQERNNVGVGVGFWGALAPKGQASVDVVTIDKAAAEQLLALNHSNNRRIKSVNLQRFIRALQNGEFVVGSQIVLVYGDDGKPVLTDGQHRLKAISETGIPAVMSVLRVNGAAHKDYVLRDMVGLIRTASDAALSEGVGEGLRTREMERFMAAIKMIAGNFARDYDSSARNMPRAKLIDMAKEYMSSYQALRNMVEREPDMRVGILAVALVTMEYAPAEINEAFWPHVMKPNMIANNDPRMKLYEWSMANRVMTGSLGMIRYATAAATTWNYFVDGQTLDKVYANKAMPKIKLTPFPTITEE